MAEPVIVGSVESVWRYPVKSMRGEELREVFVGFPGVYGDRLYALRSSAAHKGFPWLTAREQPAMLLCRPRYRAPERTIAPPNFADAASLGSGVTPYYDDLADGTVDVETPSGEVLAIGDPRLITFLREGLRENHGDVVLQRSQVAMTDCRPVSIMAVQTPQQLEREFGRPVDKRQFRANFYVDLASGEGFGENAFVGQRLRIGERVVVAVLARDTRCKMSTMNPETAEADPEFMKLLAREHDSQAGVYAAVLVEGMVRPGDGVALLDGELGPS